MGFSLGVPRYYRTVKKVRIDDKRLAILKWILFISIAVFVVVIELWAWGGALSPNPVSGVVTFDIDHPTIPPGCNVHSISATEEGGCVSNFAPLTELPYCAQYNTGSDSVIDQEDTEVSRSSYPGPILPCSYWDATDANIVTDTSASILSSASTSHEIRICDETVDVECPSIYNVSSSQGPFYVAQTEDFTIDIAHVVSSTTSCQNRYTDYRCSSQSQRYLGRIYSTSASQCSELESYVGPRGSQQTSSAPCYVKVNTSDDGSDQFSIAFLLESVGVSLDDCDPFAALRDDLQVDDDNDNATATTTCTTYRLDGITIQLSVGWNNFERYVGLTTPYYAYYPIVLSGAGFQQYQSVFEFNSDSTPVQRSVIDGYGTRVIVTIGGSFSSFTFLPFLITLFTAFGLIKLGKLIIDKSMQCLPEGKYYRRAKFEAIRVDLDEDRNLIPPEKEDPNDELVDNNDDNKNNNNNSNPETDLEDVIIGDNDNEKKKMELNGGG